MPANSARRVALTSAARSAAREIPPPHRPGDPALRERCRVDFELFCFEYFPNRFKIKASQDQLDLIHKCQEVTRSGIGGLHAVALPRGSGKTVICETACLWGVLYGHRRCIILVAATSDLAVDVSMASIKSELEHNELIERDFSDAVSAIIQLGGISRRAEGQTYEGGVRTNLLWTQDTIRLPSSAAGGGTIIHCTGMGGAIRGYKAPAANGDQIRPDLVLIDDPQTPESARSQTQIASRRETITGSILGLAGPDIPIACLMPCTIICKGDLADEFLDRKIHPEWRGTKSKMLLTVPKRVDLWDRYAAIRREDLMNEAGNGRQDAYYIEHQVEMDEGASVSWDGRKYPHDVSAIQHAMNFKIDRGEATFQAEYQNDPIDLTDTGSAPQLTVQSVGKKLNHQLRGEVPVENTMLTASIDVHGEVLYWMVTAWTDDFSGDVVLYGAHPDPGRQYFTLREATKTLETEHPGGSWEAALYAGLDAVCAMLLDTDWRRTDGTIARVEQVLIDASYGKSSPTIYEFAYRSRFSGGRVLPYFGKEIKPGQKTIEDWKKKPGDKAGTGWRIPKPEKRQTRHCLGDANYWKSFVADRILAPPGSAGSLSFYGASSADHRLLSDHLVAEKRTRIHAGGRTSDLWTAIPHRDNHFLDCLAYTACAASIRGAKLDLTKARPAQVDDAGDTDEQGAEPAKPTPPPPPPARPPSPAPYMPPSRGGWLSGYGGR